MVAFLFGLHPLHTESVVWICEQKDVLSALFWLTLWAGQGAGPKRVGVTVVPRGTIQKHACRSAASPFCSKPAGRSGSWREAGHLTLDI